MEAAQQALPVGGQLRHGVVHGLRVGVAGDHGLGLVLADDAGGDELVVAGILGVAQHEHEVPGLAGAQRHVDAVRRDGRPAVGLGGGVLALNDHLGILPGAEAAQERLPLGVKAVGGHVDGEEGVVVAALAVLGLVVDHAAADLHLADVQVALEVGGVVHRVPQAELHRAVELERLHGVGGVGQRELLHLAALALGYEQKLPGLHAVLLGLEDRVAHAVAALVAVKRRAHRQEGRGPDHVVVHDVGEAAAQVAAGLVVAVADQPTQLGVPVEAVAAAGVGDQAEEGVAAQVVDPRKRRFRRRDDVFLRNIVKIAKLHSHSSVLFVAEIVFGYHYTLFYGIFQDVFYVKR